MKNNIKRLILSFVVAIFMGNIYFVYIPQSKHFIAQEKKNALVSKLLGSASSAQEYYRSPTGNNNTGGGGSFTRITITDFWADPRISYSIFDRGEESVTILGVGNHDGNGDGIPCTVQVQVYPFRTLVTVINE